MTPNDMFAVPPDSEFISDERVKSLWPQARGELWAYAKVLESRGITITAAQLRMAILLADEAVNNRVS